MAAAKEGDKVKIHFTGRLEDGTVFDSTRECVDEECGCEPGPYEFTIGAEEAMPGLEKAVIGMSIGESKTVEIPAAEGYGEHDEQLLILVEKAELPEDLEPELGLTVEISDEDEEGFIAEVVEIDESRVTLDANHPLAGKDLTFDIELIEIAC